MDDNIEELYPTMKIIIVGNGKVGKTTLAIKFAKNIFTTEYKKTLGVDFITTKRYIKSIDKEVEFYIWDTAGQDYYNAITRRYYKGAGAALIVFSSTDKESFNAVSSWYDKVIAECDYIPIILVMSKIDLLSEKVVDDKSANELAKQLKVNLVKVSSKDGIMVNEVFEQLATLHFKMSISSSGAENIESLMTNKLSVKKNNDEIKEIETHNKALNSHRSNKDIGFQLQTENNEGQKKTKKKNKCCK